jgi:hypothetical protein
MAANTPISSKPGADLERRAGQRRKDGGGADADEEDDHHPLAAPLVGQPAGRDGAQAEGDEAWGRVGDELGVAHVPLVAQPQCRRGREDEHEQMVEEVPDVEKQEVDPFAVHAASGGDPWR